MTTDTIRQALVRLISELFKDNIYNLDTMEYIDLIDDLAMDSITFISFIIEIEAYFGIEIPNDLLMMENFKYVEDVVLIVKNELSKKSAI